MPSAATNGFGSIAPPSAGQMNGSVVESTNGPSGDAPYAYEMHCAPVLLLRVV